MRALARLLPFVLTALAAGPAAAGDWPQFRGPRASGVAEGARTPASFDVPSGANVAWRTPIAGLAHASPIVRGGRVYVATAVRTAAESELSSLYGSPGYGAGESVEDEGEHSFELWCLDAASGAVVWRRVAAVGVPKIKRHPKATHANSTPACDDQSVVVSFGSEGLHCFGLDGEPRWSVDLGVLNVGAPRFPDRDGYQWGYASSPVLFEDRVLVQCDHEGESFLAAYALDDGRELWRTPRKDESTWGSPTVCDTSVRGRPQVIVNGYRELGGYDLDTGEALWRIVGGGDVPVPTPLVFRDVVYLTSSHGPARPLRAIRVDASGDVDPDDDDDPAVVWNLPRRGNYMQTPLVYGGLLYTCTDGGVLSCFDSETGESFYRERLGTGDTGFSASPVASSGHVYVTGESGAVFVVRAGARFELESENALGETCLATPAIADGRLYFRTRHHLVAVSDAAAAEDDR
ncbi:MAG: PQQ-binding-like beta-propeller repeat protein [Planctomycetota bacterium JB042]